MNRQLITREGLNRLESELDKLRKVDLPANVTAIEEARAHGDLSENAEYHAAKERNGIIMSKINEIKEIMATTQLVDPLPKPDGREVFGARVTVYDLDTEQEASYQVVGQAEGDANNGRISLDSPLAKALIGKEEGDEVTFKTPGGMRTLEIVKVA